MSRKVQDLGMGAAERSILTTPNCSTATHETSQAPHVPKPVQSTVCIGRLGFSYVGSVRPTARVRGTGEVEYRDEGM